MTLRKHQSVRRLPQECLILSPRLSLLGCCPTGLHKGSMCYSKVPQSGKVKEVKEELPPREGTLSSGGKVGLVTNRWEESDAFQFTTSSKKKLSCRACTYRMPYLKPSKAEQKIRSHRKKCDILKVSNEEGELNLMVARVKQNFTRGNNA